MLLVRDTGRPHFGLDCIPNSKANEHICNIKERLKAQADVNGRVLWKDGHVPSWRCTVR